MISEIKLRSLGSCGAYSVDEVRNDTSCAVVGPPLAELNKTQNVGSDWNVPRNTAKCGKFFIRWFTNIVVLHSFHDRFSLCICVNHGTLLINGEVIVTTNGILGVCGLWFRCDTLAILS